MRISILNAVLLSFAILINNQAFANQDTRRVLAKLIPPMMSSINTYWEKDNLHIEFDVSTYSPMEDLVYSVNLLDPDGAKVVNYEIPTSAVKDSGHTKYKVSGDETIYQNRIKIEHTLKDIGEENVAALKPEMYLTVYVGNKHIGDEVGYINGIDFQSTPRYTLFIPRLTDNNLGVYNRHYNGEIQEYSQRRIMVLTNRSDNQ